MTAGSVLHRMESKDLAAYLSGLVEGLSYARYLRDGKESAGMACINTWFYRTDGAIEQVHEAFAAFPDYPPGAVMSVLLDQVCE